jgi:hypothetical protein
MNLSYHPVLQSYTDKFKNNEILQTVLCLPSAHLFNLTSISFSAS